MLKMDMEYKKGILFIRLDGSLTRKKVYKINNYIVPVINKHKIKYVIYNLKNLKSFDESGYYAFLNTKCTLKKNKGKLYFCSVNKKMLLSLKRLHIKILSSEKEAKKFCGV